MSSLGLLEKISGSNNRRKHQSSGTFFNRLYARKSREWSRHQTTHLRTLFAAMSKKVPAYTAFLKEQAHTNARLRSLNDIPVMSKANYLRKYAMRDFFWNGTTTVPHVLTSTSGSTGSPTYFARSREVDEHASLMHELIFASSTLRQDESTLVIVCFGMGVWIGGVITYQAFERMGQRGYPISIITPGINKTEILKALTDLAPHYKQIVLAGYPPFIKDVLDEAVTRDISFDAHRVMLLFAAEAFTERFRDYVCRKASIQEPLRNTANIYGSADIGTMAFETPIAILARAIATEHPKLFDDLFKGINKTPTLAQFVPDFVSFESSEGEILLSGDSAMPLMRYAIGDHGGVYTFDELVNVFETHGVDLQAKARESGIADTVTELPFVYVYERIDLSTTLYGLQIYPETIKEVLLDERFNMSLTGKLTLITKYDEQHDQYLEVNIECKEGVVVGEELIAALTESIVESLRMKNSEFRELSDFLGVRATPKLVFWPYQDSRYFKPGIKQRWVERVS